MSVSDCENTKANLYELLRGELCAEESAPIRQHLAECEGCRDEESVCARLTEVVRRSCEEERNGCAPVDLRDAILRSLDGS